ncbi:MULTISPECIES: heptaprenylglyceryl phosphate synthase [Bacillaceae]|jgi:putative glycerol-1-phosphate prenyltransferase|uniref:Heptaprenylglyceryl phosphate synthase n=1 Tax=Gottfriedia luciferensis TaxID=178774 RepID=A0ABX2ZXA0_9BACI|nr:MULTISPECIES: heptaprenylglyceryl phosphate synthase [Bacillaceae]ODG93009.1 geranylgeranylglyceryl/heptaprenylglyceryl phosphate synthase [Gottfriedia luciferensis]PGZ92858.1 geranylgeranylglyceryl/heptaprenylglyceryl phosphate synthase [Bacillus sp. AFS029533]SFD69693.1 putative glycerol-1-phosphate prenyltransferase [Bacillus sp. UNCCL81]
MYDYSQWNHIFKLDPNKEISDDELEKICESGTDAILVGGTDDVTLDATISLLVRIRRYAVPCILEVSNLEAVTPGYDFYFIPTVLNSNDPKWIIGMHQQAMKEFAHLVHAEELVMEGYCILNEDCKAAKLTSAVTDLSIEDIVAYAEVSEQLLKLPIFYLEYSGTYGSPQVVEEVSTVLNNTKLFYGGGISSAQQAIEMKQFADTIVVGNIIYDNLQEALLTVKAVKEGATK